MKCVHALPGCCFGEKGDLSKAESKETETIKILSNICVVRPSALWKGPILILCVQVLAPIFSLLAAKLRKIFRKLILPPPAACLAI